MLFYTFKMLACSKPISNTKTPFWMELGRWQKEKEKKKILRAGGQTDGIEGSTRAEVRFVHAVTAGGSVNFLPVV